MKDKSFLNLRDIHGNFRLTPRRLVRFAIHRVTRELWQCALDARSAISKRSIVSPESEVVVSLTTHGDRLNRVHTTIESIAAGVLKPSRIVLYLDAPGPATLPVQLSRLMDRGLEVHYVFGGYGPHTKYYGYIKETDDFSVPLVTADDDVFYPKTWLSDLVREHLRDDRHIHCHRAHRLRLDADGIASYNTWTSVTSTTPSVLNFATGVSGVIYPPRFLACLKELGDVFLHCTPRADDVWLHAVAIRNGFQIRQVAASSLNLLSVRGTQATSLQAENVIGSRNDEQIRETYSSEDIQLLHEAATGTLGSPAPVTDMV